MFYHRIYLKYILIVFFSNFLNKTKNQQILIFWNGSSTKFPTQWQYTCCGTVASCGGPRFQFVIVTTLGQWPACFRAAHRHALQGKPDTLMDKASFFSFRSSKGGDGDWGVNKRLWRSVRVLDDTRHPVCLLLLPPSKARSRCDSVVPGLSQFLSVPSPLPLNPCPVQLLRTFPGSPIARRQGWLLSSVGV